MKKKLTFTHLTDGLSILDEATMTQMIMQDFKPMREIQKRIANIKYEIQMLESLFKINS
jgi:hypothetical protein